VLGLAQWANPGGGRAPGAVGRHGDRPCRAGGALGQQRAAREREGSAGRAGRVGRRYGVESRPPLLVAPARLPRCAGAQCTAAAAAEHPAAWRAGAGQAHETGQAFSAAPVRPLPQLASAATAPPCGPVRCRAVGPPPRTPARNSSTARITRPVTPLARAPSSASRRGADRSAGQHPTTGAFGRTGPVNSGQLVSRGACGARGPARRRSWCAAPPAAPATRRPARPVAPTPAADRP